MKTCNLLICLLFSTLAFAADPGPRSLPLGAEKSPIGLDDMYFSSTLDKVLIPAGRTGKIVLIDPATTAIVDSIGGFGTQPPADGGRGIGATSVDESGNLLLATDRSTHQLDVVDPKSKKIVTSTPLEAGPDYVRNVAKTNEIWVTEPRAEKIEIFSFSRATSQPKHSADIEVKGGPEALVIDNPRGVGYTNIDGGKTVVIDLKSHAFIHEWPNGCESAEGALLADSGKLLFVACGEGKVVSIDPDNGKVISAVKANAGIDIIAYNPKLRHLYAPGSKDATVAIISVSNKGELAIVKTLPSVERGHCVVADDHDNFYVCDPMHAGLLVYHDDH
jgi:outer membrane protein assembly factor BamB